MDKSDTNVLSYYNKRSIRSHFDKTESHIVQLEWDHTIGM